MDFKRHCLNRARKAEDGMTLVEMMVAIVIIVTVLLSSAYALNSAFEAQVTGEVKSRAVQIAREESEQARQKNYTETRLVQPDTARPGDIPVPATYKGENTIVKTVPRTSFDGDLENVGFKYVKTRELNGTKYTVKTIVTKVNPGTFDSAGANIQLSQTNINGKEVVSPVVKRITIIVTWDLGDGEKQTATTWVRSPTPAECIPPRVELTGSAGNTKWDAQERIQACEERKV